MTAKAWAQHVYGAWRQALDATGREIVYWGNGQQYTTPEMWAPLGLNMWRIKGDLHPCWGAVLQGVDTNAPLASLASPGHWNDPDFLVIGTPRDEWPTTPCFTGGLTDTEGRSQFSLWAIMAAPLVASTDLRVDSPFTIKTLTNRDVIAVDQDPLGRQGRRIRTNGTGGVGQAAGQRGPRSRPVQPIHHARNHHHQCQSDRHARGLPVLPASLVEPLRVQHHGQHQPNRRAPRRLDGTGLTTAGGRLAALRLTRDLHTTRFPTHARHDAPSPRCRCSGRPPRRCPRRWPWTRRRGSGIEMRPLAWRSWPIAKILSRVHAAVAHSPSTLATARTATSSSGLHHFKNWRGLATRYDKHALIFRAGVVLASIMLRLIPRDDDRPQLVVYAPDDGLLRRSLAPEMGAEARTFASRLNAASHGPAG